MSAKIVVILVLYRRHNAEMVVAETCGDLVVVHFVHSTLSTIFSVTPRFPKHRNNNYNQSYSTSNGALHCFSKTFLNRK